MKEFIMRNKLPIKMILWYQKKTEHSIHKCRYVPSCSNYALECYKKFNFFLASWYTLTRLLRCNPLFKPKYDPVPLTRKEKKELKMKKDEVNQ
jgi:putative membrane protein insertion efficiency factor